MYQFCVVGIDMSVPAHPRYYAWEPTGHSDRTFSADEVDQKRALQRFGSSFSLSARHGRDVAQVTRWPDEALGHSVVHAHLLPDVDERGRPVLPQSCKFVPRNSTDLLGAMLLQWRRLYSRQATGIQPYKMLVLDGTGRFALHVQDDFPETEVMAIDDPQRLTRRVALKAHREHHHFPVEETILNREQSTLALADGSVAAVILPFVFHRICSGDETRFLALVREALRVAWDYVLVAEDMTASGMDEAALRRWKRLLQCEWSAPMLVEGELWRGPVSDHFLSESSASETTRRFFIVSAANAGVGGGHGKLAKAETSRSSRSEVTE